MKDSRVTVWTNTTSHLTGSTTNTGPTIDFMASGVPVGGTYETNPTFGYGVEILQTNTSGTAQVTTWEWEISNDGSTWYNGGYIGKNTLSTASAVYRLKTGLPTTMRYARLKATNTGTGTSTSVAYAADKAGHGSPQAYPNA
jgi:hypothetical protein